MRKIAVLPIWSILRKLLRHVVLLISRLLRHVMPPISRLQKNAVFVIWSVPRQPLRHAVLPIWSVQKSVFMSWKSFFVQLSVLFYIDHLYHYL
jgi:hypothetical protein